MSLGLLKQRDLLLQCLKQFHGPPWGQ